MFIISLFQIYLSKFLYFILVVLGALFADVDSSWWRRDVIKPKDTRLQPSKNPC